MLDIASVLSCPLTFFKDTHTHTYTHTYIILLIFSVVLGLIAVGAFPYLWRAGATLLVLGLLIASPSLVMERGLWGTRASDVGAHGLSSCCSWASEHKLSSCGAGA